MSSESSRGSLIAALFVYNLILLVTLPFLVMFIVWNLIITDKSRGGMGERLGFVPVRGDDSTPRVWLHAVSVGEAVAAKPIWERLLEKLPGWQMVYSVTTDTGYEHARRLVNGRGQVIYFPFDFLLCMGLALARVRPRLVVLVETELWPNFLALAKLMGCKVLMVNGRISDRSLVGSARLGPLYRWMTANIDRYCMQSQEDADRIIQIGADPARVVVVGNSKFDQTNPEVSLGEQITLRNALGLQREERVLLAGSTHAGEEEVVLRAFRQVKTAYPDVRLIIAPRDLHRAQEIEELVIAHGFTAVRRTKLSGAPATPDAVLILDTIGELSRAYALCTASFVGGSLVSIGGHNVLEPIALGKPALFGPHMHNFRDIAAIVQQAGVGVQVNDADALAANWQRYLADPALCQSVTDQTAAVFRQHQGASLRCAMEASRLLETPVHPEGVEAQRG